MNFRNMGNDLSILRREIAERRHTEMEIFKLMSTIMKNRYDSNGEIQEIEDTWLEKLKDIEENYSPAIMMKRVPNIMEMGSELAKEKLFELVLEMCELNNMMAAGAIETVEARRDISDIYAKRESEAFKRIVEIGVAQIEKTAKVQREIFGDRIFDEIDQIPEEPPLSDIMHNRNRRNLESNLPWNNLNFTGLEIHSRDMNPFETISDNLPNQWSNNDVAVIWLSGGLILLLGVIGWLGYKLQKLSKKYNKMLKFDAYRTIEGNIADP